MYVKMKEKIRIWDTIFANLYLWFFYIIAILFLILGIDAVKELLPNQTNYLLGIFIIALADIKILAWAGRPTIYLYNIKE